MRTRLRGGIGAWQVLLPAVVLCTLSPVLQGQEGSLVSEIRFTGLQRTTESYLRGVVRTVPGVAFSQEVSDGDIVRLMRTGRFLSATVETADGPDGLVVTFSLRERPMVSAIRFTGNRALGDDTLREQLPYDVGDPFDVYRVREGRGGIETVYRDRGYGHAVVTVDLDAGRASGEVVYEIEEGPRVRVTKMTFEGNDSISVRDLKKKVRSRAAFWIIRPGTFDVDLVESDAVSLQNYYHDEGFLDARVSYRVDPGEDVGALEVVFTIVEGVRYRIEAINVVGNAVLSTEEILSLLGLDLEGLYKRSDQDNGLERVRNAYGERGHIFSQVNPVRVFSTSPGYVVLTVQISEGEMFRVGRVVVRGNEHTQDKVVRRALNLFPGDVYDTSKTREAEESLRGTQIFERSAVTPAGSQPGTRDILMSVVEAEASNDLIFGFGVTSNNGLVGTVLYDTKNFNYQDLPRSFSEFIKLKAFRGAGQRFRMEIQPGTLLNRFRVDFTEPFLFDQPVRFDLGVYHFTRGRNAFMETRTGSLVSFGKRLKDGWGEKRWFKGWYREIAFRAERAKIGDVDIFDDRLVRDMKGSQLMTSAKLTLVRDRTDSRFLPSSGDRLSISYEQFMGDWTFGKTRIGYAVHKTLDVDEQDRKHIMSWRADAGFMLGTSPVFEKFYAGGLGSIRGFQFRGVGPRGGLLDRDPIGGDFMFTTSLEYSFPVYTEMLRGVVFTDMGTVEEDFGLTQWRASVGIGVRLTIDLFGPLPIELDLAIPVTKGEEDDEQVFSFFVGRVF